MLVNTGSSSGSGTSGKRRRRTAGSSGSSGNGGVHASSVDCIDETLVCVVGSHIVMLPATSLLAVTSPFTSADSSGGRAASGTMSSSSSNIVNASVMSVDAAGTKRLRTLAPGWPGALLIADDEPDIADIVSAVAEDLGYEVTYIQEGSQVASRVEVLDPAVIVLDLRMPGTDGVQILSELAERGCTAQIGRASCRERV